MSDAEWITELGVFRIRSVDVGTDRTSASATLVNDQGDAFVVLVTAVAAKQLAAGLGRKATLLLESID